MNRINVVLKKNVHLLFTGLLIFSFAACSNLVLKPTDYAWPVESVLKVDEHGFVKEGRNSLSFNALNLFLEETGDSTSYLNKEIRLIRDMQGYYYITADKFKNVYVFENGEGKLTLEDKILISETGINDPAFNQRQPYIELMAGDQIFLLTNEGVSGSDLKNDGITKSEDKNEN